MTGQIPARTPMKGSPGFPQPLQTDQQGAFPGKQADLLPGGPGDNKSDRLFSKKQLRAGVRHEAEHTTNKAVAKEIAKDHLTEHPAYYAAPERKHAASKPKWGKWEMHGLEALNDIGKHMRTSALTNSEFELPADDEKEATAAEPVSEFAAAFFLGCRERGLSLQTIYGVTKSAAALDVHIAAELATLPDAFFTYCGRLEKRALANVTSIGDYMPPAPRATPTPAAPAPAASPAAAPAAAPVPTAPVTATPTPAAATGNSWLEAPGATASAMGGGLPGLAIQQAGKRLPGWLAAGRQKAVDVASNFAGDVAEKTAPRIGEAAKKELPGLIDVGAGAARKQLANPQTAEVLGKLTSDTVGNAGGNLMNTVFQGWSDRDPNRLGGQMAQFWDTMRNKGITTAIGEAWGKMSPEQQWGLLAGVGGPLLGLGTAAAGHPLLGLGIGAAGLAGGGYGLYQGAGKTDSTIRGPGELGRDWYGKADQATQAERSWWDQQVADRNAQTAQQASELARAAGTGAGVGAGG